jgi:hypothetical protein
MVEGRALCGPAGAQKSDGRNGGSEQAGKMQLLPHLVNGNLGIKRFDTGMLAAPASYSGGGENRTAPPVRSPALDSAATAETDPRHPALTVRG